jgi:hypothetical protein
VLGQAGVVDALAGSTGGRAPHPKTPTEALRLLQAGNKRYRKEKLQLRDYSPVGERRAAEQKTRQPLEDAATSGKVIDERVPTVKSLPKDERNLARCVPANAIAQAKELARHGPIVAPAISAGKLRVVAGVYNIANGAVSVVH